MPRDLIGTHVGTYEILSLLGKGGMGEVYRARDSKLKRDVAVKVLPDEFSRDPERVNRFQREAETLASLNHPNIGTIYDMQAVDGARFLILELVEGETLGDMIRRRGRLPLEEAISIGRQICEALEAAHEKGIVHRDLKPDNIKINPDGMVKVLDFGLARIAATSTPTNLSHSPTLTAASETGAILGTPAYMSPEQAKGAPGDHRSDVFSFGCVWFEMLTGKQAFKRETVAEILSEILLREPDLTELAAFDYRVSNLLARCFHKSPTRRWQAVGDLRIELEALAEPSTLVVASQTAKVNRLPQLATIALTAIIVAIAMWVAVRPPTVTAPSVQRFSIVLPEDQRFGPETGVQLISLSRDGNRLAYVANNQIYLREMASLDSRPVSGATVPPAARIASPFFSPDGQWLGFSTREGDAYALKKIPINGGNPVTICQLILAPNLSFNWTGDQIFFSNAFGISQVSASGGEPRIVVPAERPRIVSSPEIVADGNAVLYTSTTFMDPNRIPWDAGQIIAQRLPTGLPKVLINGGSAVRYLPTGHLIYARGNALFAVAFDVKKIEIRGNVVPVLEDVGRVHFSDSALFSYSDTGTLAYIPGNQDAGYALALADRQGKVERLNFPTQKYQLPRISPDGKQFAVATEEGILWIGDLRANGPLRKLTFQGRSNNPIWTPDGRFIIFQSDRDGSPVIFRKRADGTGTDETLTKLDNGASRHVPQAVSPDGNSLLLGIDQQGATQSLWTLQLNGNHELKPFTNIPNAHQVQASFSPDGKWVSYVSDEPPKSGFVLFAKPFPDDGTKFQIATELSRAPVWSPDGKELFYQSNMRGLMAVPIQTGPPFKVGNAVPAGPKDIVMPIPGSRNFDVTRDGKQFLVVVLGDTKTNAPPRQQINIVLNWFEELRQRAPVR